MIFLIRLFTKTKLTKLAVLLLGFTWGQAGAAQTTVLLCNSSGHELHVTETYDYFYEGTQYWKEHGSWIIDRGQCQYTPTAILVDRAIGYAFFAYIDGEEKNLVFSFGDDVFIRNNLLGTDFMCARTNGQFGYAPRTSSEVGRNCPDGARKLKFSFWHHERPRFTTKRYIDKYQLGEFAVYSDSAELITGGKHPVSGGNPIVLPNADFLGPDLKRHKRALREAKVFALENDAIGVVLDSPHNRFEQSLVEYGKSIVDALAAQGEKALFFIGSSAERTSGYAVSFIYGKESSESMLTSESLNRVGDIVREKRDYRQRTK